MPDTLESKTTVDKVVKYLGERIGTIVDEVNVIEGNKYKYFIQKIARDDRTTQYRFCYYLLNSRNKVSFGRYVPEVPEDLFKKLIKNIHLLTFHQQMIIKLMLKKCAMQELLN